MKVSSAAVKALDSKAEVPILSLVPDEDELDVDDHTKTCVHKLRSDPTDANSPKVSFTMGYADGTQSVRFHLNWYANVQRVFEGLNITSGPNKHKMARMLCRGTARTYYDECMEHALLEQRKAAATTAMEALVLLHGEAQADYIARRTAEYNRVLPLVLPPTSGDVDRALRGVIRNVCPYKALALQKRFMRRKMRKPHDMKIRQYAGHLYRINTEELPLLPPGGATQSLPYDELLDIFLFGIPKNWVKEMDKQDFDPMRETSIGPLINFCERLESTEDTKPSATVKKSSNDKGSSARKKSKFGKKKDKSDGDKWCEYHESNTHDTSECTVLRKMKASKKSDGDKKPAAKKTWSRKSDDAKTFTKKELNALVKKVTKSATAKVKKELHAAGKRKKDDDDDDASSAGSVNLMEEDAEIAAEMADVDRQLQAFDFAAEEGEISC